MSASAHRYHPFYCEENVWWLCQEERFAEQKRYAVFISNASRCCAIAQQRVAPADAVVAWDYHVVMLLETDTTEIWDLDSRLGAPLPLEEYLVRSFLPLQPHCAHLAPQFRLVPAAELLAIFASDRRHMRDADGSWQHPPPEWPAPTVEGQAHNLMRFVDLRDDIAGEVLDLEALRTRFGQ